MRLKLSEDQLASIIGSTTKVAILQMLQRRPRCLSEMAEQLNVSEQAVLKHLRMLEDMKIVKSSDLPETCPTMVRRIYQLVANVEFDIRLGEHLSMFHAFVALKVGRTNSSNPALAMLVDKLNDIEDEKARVRRRLRTAMERELRLVEDLFELERATEELLEAAQLDDFDRILVKGYLESGLQGSDQVSKSFKVDPSVARRRLEAALALRQDAD